MANAMSKSERTIGRRLIKGGDVSRAVVEDAGVLEVEEMEEEAAAMEVVSRVLVRAAMVTVGATMVSVSEEFVDLTSSGKAPGREDSSSSSSFSSFNVSSSTFSLFSPFSTTAVTSPNTLLLVLGLPSMFIPGIKPPDDVVDDKELADNPRAGASSARIDQRGLPVALLGDSFSLSTLAFSLPSLDTFIFISKVGNSEAVLGGVKTSEGLILSKFDRGVDKGEMEAKGSNPLIGDKEFGDGGSPPKPLTRNGEVGGGEAGGVGI